MSNWRRQLLRDAQALRKLIAPFSITQPSAIIAACRRRAIAQHDEERAALWHSIQGCASWREGVRPAPMTVHPATCSAACETYSYWRVSFLAFFVICRRLNINHLHTVHITYIHYVYKELSTYLAGCLQ